MRQLHNSQQRQRPPRMAQLSILRLMTMTRKSQSLKRRTKSMIVRNHSLKFIKCERLKKIREWRKIIFFIFLCLAAAPHIFIFNLCFFSIFLCLHHHVALLGVNICMIFFGWILVISSALLAYGVFKRQSRLMVPYALALFETVLLVILLEVLPEFVDNLSVLWFLLLNFLIGKCKSQLVDASNYRLCFSQ